MHQIIEQVTGRLVARLSGDQDAYTLQELREAGLPPFLFEKLHLQLLHNLSDSVELPGTEWARMDSDRVRSAWRAFLDAIEAEVLLPAGYVRSLFESVVEEVVDQLTTPRAALLELLAPGEEAVSQTQAAERSREFVVYSYMGLALPRYMQKREIESLPRERIREIIAAVDDRVTAHYTPLNWGQLLEPWFELMGEEIDCELVQRFFSDKGKPGLAKLFDEGPDRYSRGPFIEQLTMGLIRLDDTEDDTEDVSESELQPAPEATPEPGPEPGPVNSGQQPASLVDRFRAATEEEEPEENEVVFRVNHRGKPQSETGDDSSEMPAPEADEHISAAMDQSGTGESDTDLPIWQQFLGADQEEDDSNDRSLYDRIIGSEEHQDEQPGSSLADRLGSQITPDDPGDGERNPVSDPANTSEPPPAPGSLRTLLFKHENDFISHIFGGSRDDYFAAIERLDSLDTWKDASSYLYKDVFKQHGVSLYSDEAIEFTDRLQRWYEQKS